VTLDTDGFLTAGSYAAPVVGLLAVETGFFGPTVLFAVVDLAGVVPVDDAGVFLTGVGPLLTGLLVAAPGTAFFVPIGVLVAALGVFFTGVTVFETEEEIGFFGVVPMDLEGVACGVGFLTVLVVLAGLPCAPPATLEMFVTPAEKQ
jgi:hypothetical protein